MVHGTREVKTNDAKYTESHRKSEREAPVEVRARGRFGGELKD